MRKSISFLSVCLCLSIVLGGFGLSTAFADKISASADFTQIGAEDVLDNSGDIFNQVKSQPVPVSPSPQATLTPKIEPAAGKKSPSTEAEKKNYVEGEVLVKYKNIKLNLNTLSGKAAASRFEYAKSLEKKEDLEKDNISVLKIKDRKTVEQKIAELRNDPDVEYAQPNFQYYPDAIDTNDPNRGSLWGLDNTGQTITGPYGSRTITYVPTVGTADADIDAPEAWAVGETAVSAPVIVAVIDTGVAYNHPDLAANMWNGSACIKDNGVAIAGGCIHGFDYEDIDITPLPTTSAHGTHVAGTIAAAKGNGLGVIGVAPHAKIMAIKTSFTTANIVRSMSFAKINGAKIVNASWGSNFFNGTYGQDSDQALYNAIKNFPGIFVTAAGNNAQNHDSGNPNTIPYPAGFGTSSPAGPGLANIIVAAATDQKDALATFSDYGSTTVDVGAPGTNILSSVVTNISVVRETFEGTSTPNLPSGWIKGGLNNKWGTYDFKDGIHGKVLYGYALSGPYDNNSNTTVSSPKFNLAGASRANISFFARCDTEYVTNGWTDYMQLEYSADGGLHFSTTTDPYNKSSPAGFRWDEATFDRLNGAPPDGGGLAQFNYRNIPIPARYLTSDFKLRFRWVTDSSDNLYDGCLVDDITITKFSDGSDNRYDYLSGTSMAVPHVAGLAALVEAYNPSLSTAQVKKAILAGSDRLPGLFGKTNSGRRINAYGALHAVDPGNP